MQTSGTISGDLLDAALGVVGGRPPDALRHVERIPARDGLPVDWPAWVDRSVRDAFVARGIHRPWRHQAETASSAHAGRHTVVSTGTASGKSLGYQLPVLSDLTTQPRATALYLSPTKALAADQLGTLDSLGLPGLRPAVYDGDTPIAERDWARDHGRIVLSNPDMLHRGILPQHARWRRFLRGLQYVVIDECHSYRGVFGSHVALVLRRLRRLAALYGSDPVFVLASATVAEPARSASLLIGAPVVAVTEDCAPRPGADFVLWEPPVVSDGLGEMGAPLRRPAPAETAEILARLVSSGARTLAFVRSRHGAEQTALTARRLLSDTDPALAHRVEAYRGGYLPEERRALERDLGSGDLLGLATTNALELGIDIAGLDAAVLAGYPGTLASMWQQAGRAGRSEKRALVVFVARDDPLDSYLVHHPEAVFGRPVETSVTDPGNPRLLAGHLRCAAAEHHLDADDVELFGGETAVLPVISTLLAERQLRARPTGWYHTDRQHPADEVDLRGSGDAQVVIVESDTGRLLGTIDHGRSMSQVHTGAVHLHRGISYLVDDLDLDAGVAMVHAERPEWTTMARSVSRTDLLEPEAAVSLPGGVRVGLGAVRVTDQVVGYSRRRIGGEIIDTIPLDMPEQVLETRGVWYSIEPDALIAAGLDEMAIPGALHAAEHAAIALLPLFAGCDRRDIGGLSMRCHPDTGLPTVVVHDGRPGGSGFADRGHAVLRKWLTAVRDAVRACGCRRGCPSCVQSPSCGSGNHPLHKDGAVLVLDHVLSALPAAVSIL
ncbi:DEAD/DEAH box helicase [Nakamurella sp. YIM 132087]|uniref:DEAD/DEAH box helicase n=1 Tax=Nakamurella alba TaxID=2665158 RepID=A0A7K1FSG9_9ACTN|nr:DEAD/DEAH box helicase [Nakamurella alba]